MIFLTFLQKKTVKYLWTTWQPGASKHQVLLDNKSSQKTVRLNGNGMSVTFTTHTFIWKQNFSTSVAQLRFSQPAL
jgi:hypothetical protein